MTESTPTPEPNQEFILIAHVLKPYGLLGEIKVRPESFDLDRHQKLSTVWFKRGHEKDYTPLKISASRGDDNFWYFKFQNVKTPEAAAEYSGGMLFIPESERLELPEGMVYFSDVVGLIAYDENGATLGPVVEIQENSGQDLLVIQTPRKEIHIPWNDHFVTAIQVAEKKVIVDISQLREILDL